MPVKMPKKKAIIKKKLIVRKSETKKPVKKQAVTAKPAEKKPEMVVIEKAAVKTEQHEVPRIECNMLIAGIAYRVDASSLEHTIGAGRWGYGKGLVDGWPDAAWTGLLVHLRLPADPLDRETAGPAVKRIVQQLWYEYCGGGVPAERAEMFKKRDEAAAEHYKQDFVKVKELTVARSDGMIRARGGETVYTPTAKLKAAKDIKGQAAQLLDFFKASKFAPATTKEAADGMMTAGLKTTTKP
jgi:hypothetical protein